MKQLIKEIKETLNKHPHLNFSKGVKGITVYGEISLFHPIAGEFDKYEVQISFPKDYPLCFPKVYETSKKIPRNPERHVNPDGTLCLAVEPEEKAITSCKINFEFFIQRILVPHLSRETFRSIQGYYPDGEFSHGDNGIWEYYESVLHKKNKQSIINELEYIVNTLWPQRNKPCPCGSNLKFKKCHLPINEEVLRPGKKYVLEISEKLKKNYDNA